MVSRDLCREGASAVYMEHSSLRMRRSPAGEKRYIPRWSSPLLQGAALFLCPLDDPCPPSLDEHSEGNQQDVHTSPGVHSSSKQQSPGPPIWPGSLLARRAPSDQRRCAGRRFQILLRLACQFVLDDKVSSSPLLRGSPIAACPPPGWASSLQSWSEGARRSVPDEPLALILPSIRVPRNRKYRD